VDAPKGRYPYAVSLQDSGRHKCGGSLIAPDIVLSAGTLSRFVLLVV
jgi:hypothetical protein